MVKSKDFEYELTFNGRKLLEVSKSLVRQAVKATKTYKNSK